MEALQQPRHRLMARDVAILRSIHTYRPANRLQIQHLHFGPTFSNRIMAIRRLKALLDLGLVQRVPQGLVEGKGARPAVYALTEEGAHLIGVAFRQRETRQSIRVQEHTLATNTVLMHLEAAAKAARWEAAIEAESPLKTALKGKKVPFPDGRIYFTRIPLKTECYLIEFDRGTESPTKFSAKIRDYLKARKGNHLQEVHDCERVRVLFVVRDRNDDPLDMGSYPDRNRRRLKELLSWTRQLAPSSNLFGFATEDTFLASNPLTDPIWLVTSDELPHRLITP